jgi:hypothetical protein
MKSPRTGKQTAFLVFTTLADIGSFFMAVFYVAYVVLMILLDVGPLWLNGIMIGITVLYAVFVIVKIAYLNRVMQRAGRVKTIVRLSSKYTRYVLRVINAAFVVLTLVGTQFWENIDFSHVIAIIGIVVMSVSLFLSIVFDIWSFIIKHGVKQIIAVSTANSRAGSGSPQIEADNSQVVEAYGEEVK